MQAQKICGYNINVLGFKLDTICWRDSIASIAKLNTMNFGCPCRNPIHHPTDAVPNSKFIFQISESVNIATLKTGDTANITCHIDQAKLAWEHLGNVQHVIKTMYKIHLCGYNDLWRDAVVKGRALPGTDICCAKCSEKLRRWTLGTVPGTLGVSDMPSVDYYIGWPKQTPHCPTAPGAHLP